MTKEQKNAEARKQSQFSRWGIGAAQARSAAGQACDHAEASADASSRGPSGADDAPRLTGPGDGGSKTAARAAPAAAVPPRRPGAANGAGRGKTPGTNGGKERPKSGREERRDV